MNYSQISSPYFQPPPQPQSKNQLLIVALGIFLILILILLSSRISKPPVDCVGDWLPCSASCGDGTQKYKVTTNRDTDGKGKACDHPDDISRNCKIKDCIWPDYDNNQDFHIKLRGTNSCLEANMGSSDPIINTNVVLREGCDEASLRYKVFSDGQIQHQLKPGIGGKCLHPRSGNKKTANYNDDIIFVDTCNDYYPNKGGTLRYRYVDGQIKNVNSGLCLNADSTADNTVIRLNNCSNASKFDLV
jgi:hypothetical protein